jgi:hypothetical protein
LRRFRTIRVSAARASMSDGVSPATCSGSNPWNASRKPSHFASITRQLIPDWKTDFVITSR